MELTPAQKKIVNSNKRFRVVNCGRRFGKTTLSVYEMVGKAVAKKDRQICYIAKTYQQARDICWTMLKKIVNPVAYSINEHRLEITLKTQDNGESKIFLKGWESVEPLRGMKFDFLVLDEVASYRNFLIGWHEVLRPTLTDTKGECLFTSTPKGFNHFYDLYNTEDDNFESFHFTSYDNPFLSKEEIDQARNEMTEDRFAQEYLAEFRKMEGLVYKEFNRDIHLFEEHNKEFKEIICGVDFGYTNPSCILKIGVDNDNNFYILEEWYKKKQTTAQIVEKTKLFKPNIVYPDPAEPDRIKEMENNGLNVREVNKDIAVGIDRIREIFKQNRIFIHKSCKFLINELETYRYPEKKPDKNEEEKPIKENDHACDALRYALYTYEPSVQQDDNFDLYAETYY